MIPSLFNRGGSRSVIMTLAGVVKALVRPEEGSLRSGSITSERSRSRYHAGTGPALCVPGSRPVRTGFRPIQVISVLTLAVMFLNPISASAVPAGTIITNTAQADFILNGNPQAALSNSVTTVTTLPGVPSTLELFLYSPSSPSVLLTVGITPYFDGVSFTPAPAPTDPATGTNISLGVPVPLEPASNFNQGDAVFMRLIDPDGNINPAVADTLLVTIEDPVSAVLETIWLNETGPDTGAFTGYILSGAPSETVNDGILYGYQGAQFFARYTDPTDGTDTSSAFFVFDAADVLWVTASAGKDVVSVGDFLTYTVTVENTSGATVPGTILTTDLPLGFRYEAGTTKIEGLPSSDPLTSPDGRSLAFSVGDIPPGGSLTITVVTKVGAGARTGKAVALNVASSGLIVSNTGLATVRVTEDLFRSRSVILGRVLSGACGEDGTTGVRDITIFLEDGTRVVTDEKGRYHFEGIRSGAHVVQVDLETVPEMYEIVACDEDTRQAGRPWSRFVDLHGGAFWRVDFYLVPKAPEEGKAVLVLKTVAETEKVTFSANMRGEQVPLRNVRFQVTLPDGIEFEAGTARLEGESLKDPDMVDNTLVWNVGDFEGVWERGITFETRVREGWDWSKEGILLPLENKGEYGTSKNLQGRMSEAVSRASVIFDTPLQRDMSTPEIENVLLKVAEREETRTRKFVFRPHFETFEAQLTREDREALDIIAAQFNATEIDKVQVSGHTDNVPISARGRRIHEDNYHLSEARARSVAMYLRSVWDLPSGLFTTDGKGPDEPVASNNTARGRTLNRRVEVNVITNTVEKRSELQPMDDQNVTEIVIKGLRPGEDRELPGPEPEAVTKTWADPTKDLRWLETENGTLRWALPEPGFLPHIPSLKIAVVHPPQYKVRIQLDGVEINGLHFDSTTVNTLGTAALSFWRGVDIVEGDNRLTAVAFNNQGTEVDRIEQIVHYSGPPVGLEYRPDLSRLVADGKTPPVIAVRLTDESGYPARRGIIGQYYAQAPVRTLQEARAEDTDEFADQRGAYSTYSVKEDGIAYLELEPTTHSGEAVLRVRLDGEDREVPVWLNAMRDEWILVGLAEGTVGYNVASGNMESLEDSGIEEDLYTDGRLSFFARGRVKGEYLLTMSYDTNGPHGASGEGHHGTIDPDAYYTLYGDATEQDYEAPTSKKLYLKIEKKSFYALFGDTETGLKVTELSRYDRRITGLRSELRGQVYSYNLFAAQTEQGFIKDEIPGDGTSGLYRLSAGDIVHNSEKVTIEVRDRFQSHVVLSITEMARHHDYNIDYDEGTLFFKKPVPQRDAGFNPVYIVVDYETEDPDATGITFGARGQAVLPDGSSVVGLSVIREESGDGEGDLVGLDAAVKISDKLEVKAEAASSSSELFGNESEGWAYILEVQHNSDDLSGKAYLRQQDEEFGLGHQKASEDGMRKVGAEAEYRLTDSWNLTAEVFAQENLDTGADRNVEELGATYDAGRMRYSTSVRQATDTDSDGTEERTSQLTAGVNWDSEDSRWKLRASHEQSLDDNTNTDYPTRTLLGSDYRLNDDVSLYAEQEYTDGDETSVSATRLGLNATPWEGGTASSSIDHSYNENSQRVYATTGLSQNWHVSDQWRLSAGFEGANVIEENTSEPLNPGSASASSEEDYAAVSLGAGYKAHKWEANLRLEARDSASSDKWGVVSGVFGEPSDGVGLSADLKHFRTEDSTNVRTRDTDLRLGLVYRPWYRTWTFLDRLDYVVDDKFGGSSKVQSWKVVNNFNANYRPHDDLQVSFQLGAKYVKDTVDGELFDSFTQLFGTQGRYDLTDRWDIGAWVSILDAADAGTTEYGLGASLGYALMENVWLSFGYNLLGFEDTDFSQGDFTAQGPYVKFRLKFDQEDLKGILKN